MAMAMAMHGYIWGRKKTYKWGGIRAQRQIVFLNLCQYMK
jgi:hypothetical protein